MKTYIYILLASVLTITSCNQENTVTETTQQEQSAPESNIVKFSDEQIDVAGIKTGILSSVELAKEIVCTGVVEANPENLAKVSSPVDAFIDEINVKHGEFINKGSTVLVLKHTYFVDLQSNYLRLKNELEFKTEEFNRQKKLYNENAVSKKKFNEVKSDYNSTLINKKSLEQKLLLLGIVPNSLTAENISSTIELKAPFSGFVDEIKVNIGQYVEPKDVLFEMVNPNNFNIMLDVYSKYKHLIKKGGKVVFRLCSTRCDTLHATIFGVGQLINNNTKTFRVHAKPNDKTTDLTVGAFINAKILVNNTKVDALPVSSVITNSQGSFVFIQKTKNKFELITVQIGDRNDRFIEIQNPEKLENKNIVIKGANYLYSKI